MNEPPILTPTDLFVSELSEKMTPVGMPLVGYDEDGDSVTYSIVGGNEGETFSISSATGQIFVFDNSSLEYPASFNLTVEVADTAGLSSSSIFSVYTVDGNWRPLFTQRTFKSDIVENSDGFTLVGDPLKGYFTDQDTEQAHTFSIAEGGTSNILSLFGIDPDTGQIYLKSDVELDYEQASVYVFTVVVTDDGPGHLSDTATYTIEIVDENESPWIEGLDDSGVIYLNVDENSPQGKQVGNVPIIGRDNDFFGNEVLTYSLESISDDEDSNNSNSGRRRIRRLTEGSEGDLPFSINPTTGYVTIASDSQLDYEDTNEYQLTVRVTDTALNSNTATLSISINDINEAPSIDSLEFAVSENSPTGTTVGSFEVSDPDTLSTAFSTHSFIITAGNDNDAFTIGDNGDLLVQNTDGLDFESVEYYELTVVVTDGTGSGAISVPHTIFVDIIGIIKFYYSNIM